MSSYHFDHEPYQEILIKFFTELESLESVSLKKFQQLQKKYLKGSGTVFAKDELLQAYRQLAGKCGLAPFSNNIMSLLRKKPTRTVSGVTPVTVLTKPFPCPGKCIFCPNDIRMPKSYLSDEPGAQRAERNYFDPYLQTYNRLQALYNTGHTLDKVEIIVLGGTWSFYPEAYQIWFIKECFRALNEFGKTDGRTEVLERYATMQRQLAEMAAHVPSMDPADNQLALADYQIKGDNIVESYNQVVSSIYTAPERLGGFDTYQTASWDELFTQHQLNEQADQRCIGLVVETRPDNISEREVIRIRKLGCTKVQIGFQSVNDEVLRKNHRGHDVAATRRAVKLLRQAGFKIHAHWMANLYGSSVEEDKKDYDRLFSDPDFRPDELKVYPCSLIESAELMQYYRQDKWRPYTHDQLLEVVSYALTHTPPYCRLTRIIRDIPSTDIVVGNLKTNFRQIAEQHVRGITGKMQDIRAREVKELIVDPEAIQLDEVTYQTSVGEEIFLQYIQPNQENKPSTIVAFLRLSLPSEPSFIPELDQAAVIREIHVYGRTVGIGQNDQVKPQHSGLGKKLIERAIEIARQKKYTKLAVISAIGTREYYRQRGFSDDELYQSMKI